MTNMNDQLEVLRDLGAAMRIAEREDAKTRHGSTPEEYHRARMLGEAFCSQIAGTSVKAVRDLPENAGVSLLIPYRGKDRLITMTYEQLNASSNDPEKNETLFLDWLKLLKSPASVIAEPQTVQGTAKRVVKKTAAKRAAAKEQ